MKLPNGMIHSDLFRDNVLARGDKVTGIIDYYYSFNGPLIYELAVIINDWCVNKDGAINLVKYNIEKTTIITKKIIATFQKPPILIFCNFLFQRKMSPQIFKSAKI